MCISLDFESARTTVPRYRALRWLFLVAVAGACLAWEWVALVSLPWIVTADSDHGAGAMRDVGAAVGMAFLCGVALIVGSRLVRGARVRAVAALVLLAAPVCFALGDAFDCHDPDLVQAGRYGQMALMATLLVIEYLDARRASGIVLPPHRVLGWLVLVPALCIATDHQGRVYLGRQPAGRWRRPALPSGARSSLGAREMSEAPGVAVSHRSGLRATGYNDGKLVVENLVGGPAVRLEAEGRDHRLKVLALSADGRSLAAADNHWRLTSSVIKVWDVESGDATAPPTVVLRNTLHVPDAGTCSLVFFPGAFTLASSHDDGTVRLWDPASGHEEGSFVPHPELGRPPSSVHWMAASPDGRRLATRVFGCIKLWDRHSLRRLRTLDTTGACVSSLALTPDGSSIITVDDEYMQLWPVSPSLLPAASLLVLACAILVWMIRATPCDGG